MKSSYSHNDYSIAWICALPLEMAAAKAMLDETHPSLPQSSNDHNVYTLGSISGHAVVISCLPYGVYGTTSAATVLAEMRATFPCLQFALMVGIGGGVPSGAADVRLGDVVVSKPTAAFGGVVQYDYGKATNHARFERAGTLNKPPVILLNAMAQIESDHLLEGETITNIVTDLLEEKEGMRKKFSRPDHDWLFKPHYLHETYGGTNTECLKCNQRQLVKRATRPNDDVRTHYGLIASGNGVMKDAQKRDLIAQELDILCFEMEAAGLMDQLPCLVIRGICDYCDSHKNKKWQGYASLTAAAYAKHLLSIVPSSNRPAPVESENQSWMVPFQRNPKFTGRGEVIKKLEEFVARRDGPKKFSLAGLGGMGKTQVALELAYRVRDKDPDCSVFWISAVSNSSIEQAYMSMAQELELKEVDPANVKSRVQSHLSRREMGKWLIIYDNADDPDMWLSEDNTATELKKLIPYSDQGRVLFTTRNRQLAQRLVPSNVVSITEMDEETATEVLRKSLIQKDLLDDPDVTTALLKQLTFLPLAITQAATYINNTGIQLPDYLALLQEQEQDVVELLSENFEDEGRYLETQNPVAMTWLISFHHIQRQNPLAIDYLSFMACINPRNIPRSLLLPASSLKRQTDALGLLSAYSFITTQKDRSFSLHRLVHLATRNWLRQNDLLQSWLRKATNRLDDVFPNSQYTNRPLWRLYMPHALYLIKEDGGMASREGYAGLLQRIGRCLHKDGRYNEAEGLLRNVVDIQEAKNGSTDVLTLVAMGHLASTYRKQGRWKEAEQLELQILETSIKELGPEHRNTLDSMHHLTLIYSKQRRWKEAEELEMEVVEISTRVLGEEHPDTLNSLFNLASLYWEQGRLDEAEELEARLLELSRKVIGVDHPDTLMNMHNLAFTWHDMGRHEEAFKMMEDCIQLRVDTLGPEHADTVSAVQALQDWREKEKKSSSQPRNTRRLRESSSKSTSTSTLKSETTVSLRKTRTSHSVDSRTSTQSSRQRTLQSMKK
ncbi:hypothetical protein EIK77_002893 [Talaromyces pinophilus]|nr:hypothetical protein EIK77_002893 [Talaromyces pinophilus]PCG92869.1 hypothetical protein PENOC_090410 [Penicillium occitanis (nom. inval.)]PCG93987.1 Tetratricopeptide-like helical [Penicillium occitanis (nom. inval.)]